MISKVLLYDSQYEVAEAIKKLEANGFTQDHLKVMVKDLEHSHLLNAETTLHIDLLSEIASANVKGESEKHVEFLTPFFTPQASMQIPLNGMPGMIIGEYNKEHGMESLREYGLNDDVADICLKALRQGQYVLCISEEQMESSLFETVQMGFLDVEHRLPETGATQVLNNI